METSCLRSGWKLLWNSSVNKRRKINFLNTHEYTSLFHTSKLYVRFSTTQGKVNSSEDNKWSSVSSFKQCQVNPGPRILEQYQVHLRTMPGPPKNNARSIQEQCQVHPQTMPGASKNNARCTSLALLKNSSWQIGTLKDLQPIIPCIHKPSNKLSAAPD